jgi:hypothetical protein
MGYLEVISYSELISIWKRGIRNGSVQRLPLLKKGVFSAALSYSRMIGRIVNPNLIRIVKSVADLIEKGLGQRIWSKGRGKILEMLRNKTLGLIFPSLKNWATDKGYLFWLGTEALFNSNKKTWLQC